MVLSWFSVPKYYFYLCLCVESPHMINTFKIGMFQTSANKKFVNELPKCSRCEYMTIYSTYKLKQKHQMDQVTLYSFMLTTFQVYNSSELAK